MTVYLITARELGLVKIGCTKDTDYRLGTLKTSSPADLKVEALLPGYYERERELHEQFAEHRVRGEWFKITEEIEEIIRSAGPLLMPFEKRESRKNRPTIVNHEETEARAREMLEEANRIFTKLDAERGTPLAYEAGPRRFYNPAPAFGGQFNDRYGVRGESGAHRHKLLCADLALTWEQADRLCDVLEEVRKQRTLDLELTRQREKAA